MRAAAVVLGLALVAHAGAASFRRERPVTPGGPGPNRLAVDVPLLVGARPLRFAGGARVVTGLDDLRLHDASGAEVPYLLIPPPTPVESWVAGRTLAVPATDDTSGFEVDLGSAQRIDRLRIGGLPRPFMKRARLDGSGDRDHWDVLAGEATLFDLPDEGLAGTQLTFPPGEFRYLRLTWDDRASARVPMPTTVVAHVAVPEAPPPPATFPVAFERRASEPGHSRFRLRLPGPDLPVVALRLACGGGHLLRTARVSEARLAGAEMAPLPLGGATLRRTVQGDLVAADLRIPIMPSHEADLDLVVEDGTNPPLELTGVEAELAPLPWLYFESPTGASLTARWGDPRLEAPRYDLEAMRDATARQPLAEAAWGDVRELAPAEAEPPATESALPGTGAAIDPGRFRWVRRIPPGPNGLTAIVLDVAVLAHSQDLADVRLAGAGARQVPYVVERLDEPLAVELAELVPAPAGDSEPKGASRYQLTLPYERLPPSRLVVATTARVFERRVWVRVERLPVDPRAEKQTETVATAIWRHADPDTAAPPLVLGLPRLDVAGATLVVDEGDNSPLPLERPRLLLPAHRLRFFRPDEEELTLLYGDPTLGAPRYDLALLVPRLVGASAHEVVADPEGAAPPAAPTAAPALDERLFWAALVLAVVVLVAMVARLVARPEPGPSAG